MTIITQLHMCLAAFCALTVSILEEHDYKLHCYSSENIMEEFYNYMNHEEQRIREILNQNNAMIELTADQIKNRTNTMFLVIHVIIKFLHNVITRITV